MRQSSRLLVNASVMLGRLFLTFGVGLISTRILVTRLGHSDFGLLAAMGATGTLVAFIGHSLNMSAQRALAHELGRGDPHRLIEAFNSTLALFVAVGAALLTLGLTIEPLVVSAIRIPDGRVEAATWVYRLTVLTLVAETVATPFRSVVVAHQAMTQVAAFETLRSLLTLAAVLLLFAVEGDDLVLYASFLLAGSLVRSCGMALVAAIRFPESRPRLHRIRRAQLRRVSGFAGWTSLMSVGPHVQNQAALVMLGAAFNPVVTAAYAIAMRIGGYHTNLSQVLPRVTQPAMTTREARGDRHYVRSLALLTGRYSTLCVLFAVVPLLIETEGVLLLWLGSVPPASAEFARLAMIWLTIHGLSSGFNRAAIAHGDVARYAAATTAVWVTATIVCGVGLFVFEAPAGFVPSLMLAATLAQIPLRVGHIGRLIGVGYADWLRETVAPALLPAAAGGAAAWLVHTHVDDGWARYAAVGFAYALAASPVIWRISVGAREKAAVRRVLGSVGLRARRSLAS